MQSCKLGLIALVLCCTGICGFAQQQPALQKQITAALDANVNISESVATMKKLRASPADLAQVLGTIASDRSETHQRRWRAMLALGQVDDISSATYLVGLLNDPKPFYRCTAIQSLSAIRSWPAVPFLIGKLDDRSTCLQLDQSHGPSLPVFVCDEAVRALEEISGCSFEAEKNLAQIGHRSVQPWKTWWEKRGQKCGKRTSTQP
jgi:HEAT repeat protein